MRYMLLIYENEAAAEKQSAADRDAMMGEYFAFSTSVRDAGKLRGGDPLMPVSTASTVRVRNGKAVTTDGPFAETREQLGGYYILDCTDLDEALALAARIPTARTGSVEVRPIMELGET